MEVHEIQVKLPLSSDAYKTKFSVNRDKYNKVNPSASHFSGMPMFKLATYISHLGDLRLETPASSQRVIASNPDRDQDIEWWWNLNKHVFFMVIPEYPFGTKDHWNVINEELLQEIVLEEYQHQEYVGRTTSDDDESDDELPPSSKRLCQDIQVPSSTQAALATVSTVVPHFLSGYLCAKISFLKDRLMGQPESLENDVGKLCFLALLEFALSSLYSKQNSCLVPASSCHVLIATTTKANQQCALSGLAQFTDEDGKFKCVPDILVTTSKDQCKIIGEIKSLEDQKRSKYQGEGQLGVAMALALARSTETSLLGFVASPAEIKVFLGHKDNDRLKIEPATTFQNTLKSSTLFDFLQYLFYFVYA